MIKLHRINVMPIDQTDSFIRCIVDKAFNHGNFTAMEELLAPDSSSHIPVWRMLNNRMGLKQLITSYRLAFPDLHCTVGDEIRMGDKLAGHWTIQGTHKGLFMGNPPTGKQMQVQGIIFARFEGGMTVEYLMLIDQLGLLQQLGIIPR